MFEFGERKYVSSPLNMDLICHRAQRNGLATCLVGHYFYYVDDDDDDSVNLYGRK